MYRFIPIITLLAHLLCANGVSGGNIYVSRYHGNDSASCGKSEATSCKSLAAGVAHAQSGFTIIVDGTQTELDPYPCTPSVASSLPREVYIDKSVLLKSCKSLSYIRCKNGGTFVINGTKKSAKVVEVEVSFEGLVFIDSSIRGEDCSVFVNNCSFVNTSRSYAAALNIRSKAEFRVKVTLQNLSCVNSSTSCVLVTANLLSVRVSNSVFEGNFVDKRDLGVFTITAPHWNDTKSSTDPNFKVTFTNSSFQQNYSPFKGSLYVDFRDRKNLYRCKSNLGKTSKLLHLLLKTSPMVTSLVLIDTGNFESNIGRGIGLAFGNEAYLSIRNSVFHGNVLSTIPGTRAGGGALMINGFTNISLSIVNSNFTENNSSFGPGGAILVIDSTFVSLKLRSSLFESNAAWPSGSAILVGYPHTLEQQKEVVKHAFVCMEDVQFKSNILQMDPYTNFVRGGVATFDVSQSSQVAIRNSCFVENTAIKGSLTLYIVSGYSQNILMSDTNFSRNFPLRRNISSDNLVRGLVFISLYGHLDITLSGVVISDHFLNSGAMEFCDVIGETVLVNFTSLIVRNNSNGVINIETQAGNASQSFSDILVYNSHFVNNADFAWLLKLSRSTSTIVQFQNVHFSGNKNQKSTPFFQVEGDSQGRTSVTMGNVTFTDNFILAPAIKLVFDQSSQYNPCEGSTWLYQSNVYFYNLFLKDNHVPSSSLVELQNGKYVITGCVFLDNYSSQMFSNLFLDRGSTSVALTNTSFIQTSKPRNINGLKFGRNILLHSDTFAPISFTNVTFKWGISGTTNVLLMVSQSSEVWMDNATTIQCPLGNRLLHSNYSYYSYYVEKNCEIPKLMMTSFMYSCEHCDSQKYTILPKATSCLPCPYGANCTSNIAAKPDFWGYPIISDPGRVAFSQCPHGYCCPRDNVSCPYQNETYLWTGCQGNREGILCGQCRNGYTETLFSAECIPEQHCRDYWFWPVALLFSLAFAIYLIRKPPLWSILRRKILWFKQSDDIPEITADTQQGGGYTKVLFYFYQMADLLMISDNPMLLLKLHVFVPVIGLFNFQILNTQKLGFICPVPGLKVIHKIILHFSQVFGVIICIALVYLAHAVLNKMKKRSPIFAPAGRYFGAFIEVLLLGYSTLASTTMKMLYCVQLESTYRSFYDGNVECYVGHWWQVLSVILVIAFVLPFVLVLVLGTKLLVKGSVSAVQFLFACVLPLPILSYWLMKHLRNRESELETLGDRHDKAEECKDMSQNRHPSSTVSDSCAVRRDCVQGSSNDKRSCVLQVLYGPFRRPCLEGNNGVIYWEGVLVFRRLILIVLHVFIPDPLPRMMFMSIICILALLHHVWVKPFADWKVNVTETLSLTGLVIIAIKSLSQTAFLSSGTVHSELEEKTMELFQWIEIVLLAITPLLFLFLAGIALLSQFCHCVFIVAKYLSRCTRIVFQGWEEID